MIFWLLIGAVLGYFFKPQIDRIVGKIFKSIRDNRRKNDHWDDRY